MNKKTNDYEIQTPFSVEDRMLSQLAFKYEARPLRSHDAQVLPISTPLLVEKP